MRKGMLYGSAALYLGAYLGYRLQVKFEYLIILTLLISISFVLTKAELKLFVLLSFCIGFSIINYCEESSMLSQLIGRANVKGYIEEVYSKSDFGNTYTAFIYDIDNNKIEERCLYFIKGKEKIEPGSHFKSNVKIEQIRDAGNPGLFSYKDYLRIRGIYAKLSSNEREIKINKVDLPLGLKFRNKVLNYINNEMNRGLNKENSSFMNSVMTGKSDLSQVDRDSIRQLGLSHIMAISGLHMGIISLFLIYFLRFFKIDLNIIYIIIIFLLGLYIYIIDFRASAFRAYIMISLFMIAAVLHKGYSAKKALSLSVYIILLTNPYRVNDIGFILSVLAIIAIISYDEFSLYDTENLQLMTGLKFCIIINLVLFPFLIYYFNRFNLLTFIANLIVIPLFSIAVSTAVLKLMISLIAPRISFYLGSFIDSIIMIIREIMDLLNQIDFLSIKLPSSTFYIIIYYLILLSFLKRYDLKKSSYAIKKKVFKISSLFVSIYILTNFLLDPAIIDFIDIGQGDAALIRSGKYSAMIDTGGSYDDEERLYKYTLRPYLEKQLSNKVDMVIISHDDLDHSGNLEYMYRDGLVDLVVSSDYELNKRYLNSFDLYTDDVFRLNNMSLKTVTDGRKGDSTNDRSNIIKLSHHKLEILFTGDIESEAERRVLNHDIKAEVLKVPHHGSQSSSTPDFLDSVSPKYAIISVGKNNYSHPNEDVIRRLEDRGATVYRTDTDGRIRIISHRLGYYLKKNLPKRRNRINYLEIFEFVIILISSHIIYKFMTSGDDNEDIKLY
ncbi:MAG: DNA internalization-related competence protein ComEC/Rec2 [Tissierellia bacterium]|nr:DNA internalization-related competence protein ComEC/Rec2 [Tissierellia bacterium]